MNPETILDKLREFDRAHNTPIDRVVGDIQNAIQWLPKSSYAPEARPLQEMAAKKSRGPVPISDLLIPVLIRLGVIPLEDVQLKSSEARGSD